MRLNKPIILDWKNLPNYCEYIAEPKLDGVRCFAVKENDTLKLIRDNGSIKTMQFPEIISSLNIPDGTVLDGEICIQKSDLTADFHAISKRVNLKDSMKIKILSKRDPATFVAFDIVKHDTQDLTSYPYLERRRILEKLQVPTIKQYDVTELQKKVKEHNMEGIVIKNPTGDYTSKWFKLKNLAEADFKVIGTTSVTRKISSLVLADATGREVGSC